MHAFAIYVGAIAALDAVIVGQRVAWGKWQVMNQVPLSEAWLMVLILNVTALVVAMELIHATRRKRH